MPFYKRPYLILKDKILVIKKDINKHFDKRFICFNISLITTFILFTKKLKKLFNSALTIKDLTLL